MTKSEFSASLLEAKELMTTIIEVERRLGDALQIVAKLTSIEGPIYLSIEERRSLCIYQMLACKLIMNKDRGDLDKYVNAIASDVNQLKLESETKSNTMLQNEKWGKYGDK